MKEPSTMEKELYKTPSAKLIEVQPIAAILNDSLDTEQLDVEQFNW